MAEYRPDAKDLWETIQDNLPFVRRCALALGGALLGYAAARVFGGRYELSLYASLGAGLVGFFGPRFGRRQ